MQPYFGENYVLLNLHEIEEIQPDIIQELFLFNTDENFLIIGMRSLSKV